MSEENTAVAEATGNEWDMPAEVSQAKEAIISEAVAPEASAQESSISLVETTPEAQPEVQAQPTPEPVQEGPNWEQRYQEESKTWGGEKEKLTKELQDIRAWWQAHGREYDSWLQTRNQPQQPTEPLDSYDEVRSLRQQTADMAKQLESLKSFQDNLANERARAAVRKDIDAVTAKFPGIDPQAVLNIYAKSGGKLEMMDIATMMTSYKPAPSSAEPNTPGVVQPPKPIHQSRPSTISTGDKQWDFKPTGKFTDFDDIERWAKANVPRG